VWTCDILQGEDPLHVRADRASTSRWKGYSTSTSLITFITGCRVWSLNGEDHYDNLWRTNVIGTKTCSGCRAVSFRMIFFSSAEVYGDYDQLMSEDVMSASR